MLRLLFVLSLLTTHEAHAQVSMYWSKPANVSVHPGRKDDIYFWRKGVGVATTSGGRILKTVNAGASWQVKYSDNSLPYINFRSIEALDNGAVMIAGSVDGNAFRSTDSGETWQDISTVIPDTGSERRNMCGLAHNGNTFYGVGWYYSTRARFYKSSDAGVTWQVQYLDTSLASGLVDIVYTRGKLFASGYRNFRTNKRESVVLRSTDEGASWTKVFSDTSIGGRIWKLQFLDSTHAYGAVEPMVGDDTVAMIRSSDDGATWTMHPVGKGPGNFRAQSIGFVDSLRGFMGGHGLGMFATENGGQSWQWLPIGRNFNRFFRMDPGLMYATGDSLFVFNDSAASAAGIPTTYSEAQSPHKLDPPVPNPADHVVRFNVSLASPTHVVVEVIDLSGRRFFTVAHARYAEGKHTFSWDCSSATSGTYLVRMETHDGYQTHRFVVAH